MASGAPNHDPTLSSAPAPAASAPMNLSSMDLAQLQANGMQAIPGLDPTQLMNLLRHLPNVFTKVRPFADFNSDFFCSTVFSCLWPLPILCYTLLYFLNPKFRALHVIVLRSSRLRVLHAASHDCKRESHSLSRCVWGIRARADLSRCACI
ncbi:hypothetical protein B0H14DRAFT_638784 [Mycena olivaceomarginata]|nr:hypothetical protein B0H14DRAFT_638784 [Mycena olivaceomarginata]